ncbi:hypothetical protein MFIFM68171_05368 [Madurella fahalii]|uniref:DNA endonuclease activator Ctp1 C-terminal domain-containing protein n=1 Tax=Madurella fahalii TaxID=1157608 RepID=A0ABQ0GBP0_9PEZI
MDYWARRGRPALIAALEAVCDTVEEDLAAEIRERDRDRHAPLLEELSQLKATAERADRLEQENRSLVRKLEELRKKYRDVPHDAKTALPADHVSQTTRPALAEISTNSKVGARSVGIPEQSLEKPNLETRYSRLVKQYAALTERWGKTQRAARKYRDSQDAWVKYAESLEAKVKRLEKKLQHNGGAYDQLPTATNSASKAAKPRPTGIDDTVFGGTASTLDFMPDFESTPGLGSHDDTVAKPTGHKGTSSALTAAVPQHHTGAGTNDGSASVDEETLDGISGACRLPSISPFMDTAATMIKKEPSSDGPIIVSERAVRKRKHHDDEAEGPIPARRIKSENLSSDPVVTGEATTFSPHESIDLDGEQDVMPTPRKQRRLAHQLFSDEGPILSNADETPSNLQHVKPRDSNTFLNAPAQTPEIQKGRSTTSRSPTQRPMRTHADRKKFISAAWTLDGGIADVAEETFESFSSPRPRQGRDLPSHLSPARGRLHSLLNHGSPEREASAPRPARHDRDNPPSVGASPAATAGQFTPAPKRGQNKANPPRASRLRDRRLADLRVEDFKINPKHNDGYKYAFDEVVRNKGERAELAGCTDPNCCGKKFRAMAESELTAGGRSILSRAADIRMLKNYLGNEAYRLAEMTQEARQELWLKAKTQDLADRYGRHRHRYARRPSPPGYWNPDFPSTQEIEKSKLEAEKMERAAVEERWREAMRGGGRWLFRDE